MDSVGIVFGHFNMNLNEHLLHFLKELGLILFVYSIGLQVGAVTRVWKSFFNLSNTYSCYCNVQVQLRIAKVKTKTRCA